MAGLLFLGHLNGAHRSSRVLVLFEPPFSFGFWFWLAWTARRPRVRMAAACFFQPALCFQAYLDGPSARDGGDASHSVVKAGALGAELDIVETDRGLGGEKNGEWGGEGGGWEARRGWVK